MSRPCSILHHSDGCWWATPKTRKGRGGQIRLVTPPQNVQVAPGGIFLQDQGLKGYCRARFLFCTVLLQLFSKGQATGWRWRVHALPVQCMQSSSLAAKMSLNSSSSWWRCRVPPLAGGSRVGAPWAGHGVEDHPWLADMALLTLWLAAAMQRTPGEWYDGPCCWQHHCRGQSQALSASRVECHSLST